MFYAIYNLKDNFERCVDMLDNNNYYVNYRNAFFSSQSAEAEVIVVREKILERIGEVLERFHTYITENYDKFFPFLNNLPKEKKEEIGETMSSCILIGLDVYISIMWNNSRDISYLDNVLIDEEKLQHNLEEEELRTDVLNRYDIIPFYRQLVENIFAGIIDGNEALLEYTFGEIENLKVFLGYVIENVIITCITCFEQI